MTQPSMRFDDDRWDVPAVPPLPRPRVADDREAAIPPRDTHIIQAADVIRLSDENLAVLARLQEGPATARELSAIALGYRQRVHDLRCAGYRIPKPVNSVYRLEAE